jgi:hypothetical protein
MWINVRQGTAGQNVGIMEVPKQDFGEAAS